MSLRALLLGAVTYVLLLAIVAFAVPLALSLSARVNAEVRTQAQAQADLVAATAGDLLAPASRRELTALARTAASSLRGRVLIVNANGRVLVDSAGPAEVGTSYLSRPEIKGALAGRQVQLQRASKTLGKEILATSVPIIHDGRTAGAVRVTQSVAAVRQAVRRVELAIALIGLIVLAFGLLAGSLLAGQIGRPLGRLEAVARRVAQGDLSARAEVEGSLEQRSLSSSFNEMTERMGRLFSAQHDFVADASHQLRTPLTGLRLRLEEAKALAGGPEAVTELEEAIGEVDRLSHTVDELLLLSREGERPLAGAAVALGDLVTDALRRWRPEASERAIGLAHRRLSEPGTVWAARADLERALDALLENAVRYSPPGSTVTIVSAPGRIEVRDRGPGLRTDERELVFERFRRGSAGMSGPPGHGLGLPIARELAREWGGEVSIEARDDGGATAILELERYEAPSKGDGRDFACA
jgi:two-component system, OmpR family, sensor kinase